MRNIEITQEKLFKLLLPEVSIDEEKEYLSRLSGPVMDKDGLVYWLEIEEKD